MMTQKFWLGLCLLCWTCAVVAQDIAELCPSGGIQPRRSDFSPSGIILTYFDSSALWVYDIGRNTRYPLPETVPCVGNCRLSPDGLWITYLNPQTQGYMKMRLNGTERTPIMDVASDVVWGANNTFLVWTPDHRAFIQSEGDSTTRTYLPTQGIISIDPTGKWGIWLSETSDGFTRYLVDLQAIRQNGAVTTPTYLTSDAPYFNASSWSPIGNYLAFVGKTPNLASAELWVAPLDNTPPRQLTNFAQSGASVRIDGASPSSLAWSPDGTRVAYWVIGLTGADVTTDTSTAVIHITDVNSGQTTRYCGFATAEHTPNPPHLVWSPDGTHLALGGNVEGDGQGYLLLTFDVATGQFYQMSDGIFPALGAPDVLAWGNVP
jgi:hypothetical protein